MAAGEFIRFIEGKLKWQVQDIRPRFLSKYKWRPDFLFYDKNTKQHIAVDVIYNQQFSRKIYFTEVAKAIKEHRNLRVCLFSSNKYEYGELKEFCSKYGLGLKIYDTISLDTVVPFKDEATERIIRVTSRKEGWFPKVLLIEVKRIQKLKFRRIIIQLINKLEHTSSKDKQFNLICKHINKMLGSDPHNIGNTIPFMKLFSFEGYYQSRAEREHAFHSVRLFLAGCIIIDKFYKQFTEYYKKVLGVSQINIEYVWLIASVFHDYGRIKQNNYREEYSAYPNEDDDDLKAAIEQSLIKRLKRTEYDAIVKNVTAFLMQSHKKLNQRSSPFIGCVTGNSPNSGLDDILKNHYAKLTSHGVISCIEIGNDFLKKIEASDFKRQSFWLYHIIPAISSMALHDWKIWKDLRAQDIFPINMADFPLTALLIYLDTWDDYKREEGKDKISIDKFIITDDSVKVCLTWHNGGEYLDEKIKYDSFERNVLFSDFRLEIAISNLRK